jgi:hypothetical protein
MLFSATADLSGCASLMCLLCLFIILSVALGSLSYLV